MEQTSKTIQVGDEVVTMSAAGSFRVTAVAGDFVTIENAEGVSKRVTLSNVRPLQRQDTNKQ